MNIFHGDFHVATNKVVIGEFYKNKFSIFNIFWAFTDKENMRYIHITFYQHFA